ncbi:MAG: hypothetical protein MJK18_15855 [Bdellovibrionales bacterium]|nr:hypothetical protein [Bdellovibrionales bacterium]
MKVLLSFLLFTLLPSESYAKRVTTIRLKNDRVRIIGISHRGAVLNFPTRPTKVVLGNQGAFAIEYINNDLVVSPLRSNSRAHVFVYLEGRRFNLDLYTSIKGHTLIQIRDSFDSQIEVPYVK